MKKAFTLAEMMLALVVLGIILAVLLPVAYKTSPNGKVMKFKKGNETIGTVIGEMIGSDQYYKDSDLGIKADGTQLKEGDEENSKYFCATFADIISTNSTNCVSTESNSEYYIDTGKEFGLSYGSTYSEARTTLDNVCATVASTIGAEIVATDDIVYYDADPAHPFGNTWDDGTAASKALNLRLFSGSNETISHDDGRGNDRIYKIICMDIDGIDNGEAPFGYGIKADGTIFAGARAIEWIDKNIQDKD